MESFDNSTVLWMQCDVLEVLEMKGEKKTCLC